MAILSDDPRYAAFVDRYSGDLTRFVIEVLGSSPSHQQIEMYDSVSPFGSRTSISSGHGCFAAGTPVMMADGSTRAVERIRVGDRLMGGNGRSSRRVESLARGREPMYRFTYADGAGHTVNESHVLCLMTPDGLRLKMTVRQWLERPPVDQFRLRAYRQVAGKRGYRPVKIESCIALGEGEYFGFAIDGDHLFLGADRTVLSNTGKTYGFGAICAWHLLCFVGSNTYLHAPKLKTLQEGVWQELSKIKTALNNGPFKWLAQHFIVEAERVYVRKAKMEWFITTRVAKQGNPEALAGTHNRFLLWVVDEATGVPDENFGTIGGALTDERNRIVIASQPTRTAGFFRETQTTLSREEGGPWNAMTFNSEESPLVSDQFILDKLLEYGGRDSPEYQIKVMGRFPEYSDKYLLSRSQIERRIGVECVIAATEPYGNLLVIDVAAGVYRDKTVCTHMRVSGSGDRLDAQPRRIDVLDIPVFDNTLDWDEVAGRVRDIALHISNVTVLVDVGGQGVQFAKKLRKLNVPNVIDVNWGKRCFLIRNKERFINLRAQCSVHAAEAVKDGRITFVDKHRKHLIDQGSRIPFFFGDKGEWHIMSKQDMLKDENIPSPDLWDTICMAFLEDAHYITDESSGTSTSDADRVKSAREAADEEFADA